MLYVPLVLVSGARQNKHTIQNKTLCRAYCVKMYFECFKKYDCAKPEMRYHDDFCKAEYKNCYPECLDELYVLDLYPTIEQMSEKNKQIFLRLKKELGSIIPGTKF